MDFDDTYFPLFRSMITHRYMTDATKFQFWVWCLLKASHKPHKILVGNQTVELGVGQFVFGRKKAAEELGQTERGIRTLLNFFSSEKERKLTIKTTNKFSIITVIKYSDYMDKVRQSVQQNDQHVTSKRPACDHKQEGKEVKEEPIPLKPKRKPRTPSGDHQFFVAYWQYAYRKIRGEDAFLSGADQKAIANMLKGGIQLNKLVICSAYFLMDEDKWLVDKKTVAMLQTKIGGMQSWSEMDTEAMQKQGLLPPTGTKIRDWRFWEVENEARCV